MPKHMIDAMSSESFGDDGGKSDATKIVSMVSRIRLSGDRRKRAGTNSGMHAVARI